MKLKLVYCTCFLLLVGLPIVVPLCFYIQQKHIRHEMKERLEKEQLVTLTLKNLIWHKKDKELLIDGKMFDVQAVKQLADASYLVTGLYDIQEKALFQQLNLLMKKKGDLSKQITASIAIFSFLPPSVMLQYQTISKPNNKQYLAINQKVLSLFDSSVIVPPPDLVI